MVTLVGPEDDNVIPMELSDEQAAAMSELARLSEVNRPRFAPTVWLYKVGDEDE